MTTARAFALFGHPVGHSLSKVLHEAAFRALGLPHRYELLDLPDAGALARAIDEVRSGACAGANVTMPHKEAALSLADVVTGDASRAGAANVLARDAAALVVAHNTDVGAIADAVARRTEARGAALVLGAGGAARAALVAVASLGFRDVSVMARRKDAALALAPLGARAIDWPIEQDPGRAPIDRLGPIDVVVHATSAGTGGSSQRDVVRALPWGSLGVDAFVLDLVYRPLETELCARARSAGFDAETGLGVLVAQAEAAFAIWMGEPAPSGVMERAARAALSGFAASSRANSP